MGTNRTTKEEATDEHGRNGASPHFRRMPYPVGSAENQRERYCEVLAGLITGGRGCSSHSDMGRVVPHRMQVVRGNC